VWDHRHRLDAITVPTLVIAGSADPSTPVEPHARTIVEGIPGARLEVLDAAHLATIEAADEATTLIAEHVAAHASPVVE
jgi:3-oxoadipate enol-lactonase